MLIDQKFVNKSLLVLATIVVLFSVARPIANGQTTAEMNKMASKDYQKADATLNSAYKKLLTLLDDSQKKQLAKSQEAWIKFRDCEAEFLASEYKGGTIWTVLHYGELRKLTEERTKQLNATYKHLKEAL